MFVPFQPRTAKGMSGPFQQGAPRQARRVRMSAADLWLMPRSLLAEVLRDGYPIDPVALEGSAYRGVSLGLPSLVEKATWKTFQKTFLRDPASGELRGWNVRLQQLGLEAPSTPKEKGGRPWTFGHYLVRPGRDYQMPRPAPQALMIDYGPGGNGRFNPVSHMRDPIVAVNEGSVDLLLGWSYLDLGVAQLPTPIYFSLEREGPIIYVPPRL